MPIPFKNIVTAGVAMFAVGALMGLAPPLVDAFGLGGMGSAAPAWMGSFFAAVGALGAVALPIVKQLVDIFHSKPCPPESQPAKEPSKEPSKEAAPGVVIHNIQVQPDVRIGCDHAARIQRERTCDSERTRV